MKNIKSLIYWTLFFIVEELIYAIFSFKNIEIGFFNIMLFSICFGLLFYLICKILSRRIQHITIYILTILFTIIYISQFIYYKFYQSVISVYSMTHGGQVLQFFNQIVSVIINHWYVLLLFMTPLIIYIVLDILKKWNYDRISIKNGIITALSMIFIYIAVILSFNFNNESNIYSNYNLYFKLHAPLLSTQKFGVLEFMKLDLCRSITGFKERDILFEKDKDKEINEDNEIVIEYNAKEIDFDYLITKENSEEIISMHEYFKNQIPSKKNEYTGYFEGKNVIVFVAEAFSQLAIDEELTPTLYKLANSGFKFNNFYTPLYPVSTADGEYMTDTSLIPKEGVWSLTKLTGHYMPYSYANVFKNLGYTTQAYHDNTATYYKRNSYIEAMGYDSFTACGKGLDINCKIWPQSDLEMINKTVDDYINDEHFLAYYMTVSGHLEYTKIGNRMVSKNWNLVKDLNLSEKAKSYLACNIEFDRALASLIEKLEEAGKLDDTVIVISGDHYPYGLTLSEINELSTYPRDENFEIHHMPFIIWNNAMEEVVEVDKVGSSLDVLPTVLNLFGIEYDSRLLMGRDLLSDSNGMVIFSNRSFITDLGRYNSLTRKFEPANDEVDDQYIEKMKQTVYNKFKYSKLILENDYYRIVFEQ